MLSLCPDLFFSGCQSGVTAIASEITVLQNEKAQDQTYEVF